MKELLKMQQHMAQRLERITYVIQSALVQDSGPGEDDLDNMLLSLAELKQVCFSLPFTYFSHEANSYR